jgi:hypothetical protein
MAVYCRFCGLEKFRPSLVRFRSTDLFRLLLLQHPVRCLNCEERTYLPLHRFLKLRSQFRFRPDQHSDIA